MSVLQQHGSIRSEAQRGFLSSGQAAGFTSKISLPLSVAGCGSVPCHLPASEAYRLKCTAGNCIGDLNGEPQRLSRTACLVTAFPGHQKASNPGLCQSTYCLALSRHAAAWRFLHPILPFAGPAAAPVPARSQSIAVGTDDLVDPSGAGEAYYYDPDEQVEPEPKALRWARENPWCAGS